MSFPRGVLHNSQYPCPIPMSMPIFGVGNFNQDLGTVNYNMDKNSILWVHKSGKGGIVEFGTVYKILDSIFGVPKTLGIIIRGQQRNSGIDPLIES